MTKKNRVEVEEAGGELAVEARHHETGEEADMAVLEESGVAFDPTRMHLDLTKAEKRRTTALMLAIQAYNNIIIKDAEYLREAHSQARSNGAVIRPATMDAMVVAAIQFDAFISGRISVQGTGISRDNQSGVPPTDELAPTADAVDRSVPDQGTPSTP